MKKSLIMKLKYFSFFIVLTLLIAACTKDNEEFLDSTKTRILSKRVSEIVMSSPDSDTVKISYTYKSDALYYISVSCAEQLNEKCFEISSDTLIITSVTTEELSSDIFVELNSVTPSYQVSNKLNTDGNVLAYYGHDGYVKKIDNLAEFNSQDGVLKALKLNDMIYTFEYATEIYNNLNIDLFSVLGVLTQADFNKITVFDFFADGVLGSRFVRLPEKIVFGDDSWGITYEKDSKGYITEFTVKKTSSSLKIEVKY